MLKFFPAVNSAKDLNANLLARRLHAAPRGVPEARQPRPQDQLADQADRDGLGQVRVHEEQGLGEQLLPRVRQPVHRRHPRHPHDLRDHLDARPVDGARRQLRHEPAGPDGASRRTTGPTTASSSGSPARTTRTTSARAGCRSWPTATPSTAGRRAGCRCGARRSATPAPSA